MFEPSRHRADSRSSSERGATMLEMALVTPVLVLLLFGVIDFSRYMAARAVVTKAAQNAINYAQRATSLDIDTRALEAGDPAYALFQIRRAAVQDRATQLAQSIFVSGFATYRNIDQLANGVSNPVPSGNLPGLGALILRPGEEARRRVGRAMEGTMGSQQESVVRHPTLCPPGNIISAECPAVARPTDGWIDMLKNHPMYIEIEAHVDPIIPLLPRELPIRVTAFGYREMGTDADALPPISQVIPSVTSTSTSTSTTSTTSTSTTAFTTTTSTSFTTTVTTTSTSLTTSTSSTSFTTSISTTSTSAVATTTSSTSTSTSSSSTSSTTAPTTTTTTYIRCATNVDLNGDMCSSTGAQSSCSCNLYGDCCRFEFRDPTSTVCCDPGEHLLYVDTFSEFRCGEVCWCKAPDRIICVPD